MPVVKELVAHILHHINAEAAESDSSQVPGVAGRAQLVRDAVMGLVDDLRDLSVDAVLQEVSSAVSVQPEAASFQKAITNMQGIPRPQLAIQTWVGKNQERPGG